MNNKSLQIERELMERKYGRSAFVDYKHHKTNSSWGPDFSKIAEAMGARARQVESPHDLVPTVTEAVESGQSAVIDVAIDVQMPGYRNVWYAYPSDFWQSKHEMNKHF